VLLLPAASRPLQLARVLGVSLARVLRYCREQRFADKKPSELVLDFAHARALALQCGHAPYRPAPALSPPLTRAALSPTLAL
jgi:hypothetical protein